MVPIKPASLQARKLYRSLTERDVKCYLEHWDEHKHVDLCVPDAKLYIEIDGLDHYLNPIQIIKDIKRDKYSEQGGFDTFRVSNAIVDKHIDELADALRDVSNIRIEKAGKRVSNFEKYEK